MADLSQFFDDGFDDRSVAASTGVPDPVPAGDYTLHMESAEVIPTKDGTGVMLKATVSVVSGPYEGRKIFPQFNIRNKSAQAQAIGIGEFKALCLAAGVEYEQARGETDALLYRPFLAKVGMEKQNTNPQTGELYPPRNRIMKYHPAGGAAPAPQAKQQQPAAAHAAAAPARQQAAPSQGRPWDKKVA